MGRRERELERERHKIELYESQQKIGAAFTCEASELGRIKDPKVLHDAAVDLIKRMQADEAAAWQRVLQHFTPSPDCGGELIGDLSTSLAEGLTEALRENTCNTQSVWQSLSEAFPDVNFTIDWYDASTLIAATMRVQTQAGLIRGLRLANAATEPH